MCKAEHESVLCSCSKEGYEDGQILESVAQGRCKISILADNQNLTVQELEQPEVSWSCSEQGLKQMSSAVPSKLFYSIPL